MGYWNSNWRKIHCPSTKSSQCRILSNDLIPERWVWEVLAKRVMRLLRWRWINWVVGRILEKEAKIQSDLEIKGEVRLNKWRQVDLVSRFTIWPTRIRFKLKWLKVGEVGSLFVVTMLEFFGLFLNNIWIISEYLNNIWISEYILIHYDWNDIFLEYNIEILNKL